MSGSQSKDEKNTPDESNKMPRTLQINEDVGSQDTVPTSDKTQSPTRTEEVDMTLFANSESNTKPNTPNSPENETAPMEEASKETSSEHFIDESVEPCVIDEDLVSHLTDEEEHVPGESQDVGRDEKEDVGFPAEEGQRSEHLEAADEDYDTDLEAEPESQTYDHTGRTLYLDLCKKAGVVPTGYFLRHMADDTLDLRHHGLCAAGIKPICGSLVNNCHVTSLDLSDNWLGNPGGRAVIEMMSENCFISHLVLRDNKMSMEIAENLSAVLTSNQQLTHLDLSGNEFCDKAAHFLADMLASSPRILYLNLSNNNFGEEGGYLFGKAIGENSTMLELDLSWNHIRTKGCKSIASGLAQNSCLKKFNVSWNGFGPVYGAQELGKALKANTCLEEIDISNNRIVPEGAVLIGKGLSANTTLKVLKMGKNPIQTAGCYAILNAVLKNAENTTLQKIVFHDIKVNNDFKELQLLAKDMIPTLTVELGYKPPLRPKAIVHPVVRLRRFIDRRNIRLIDFFNKIDTDQSMTVTREEFVTGLEKLTKEYGLSFTEEEMEMLITGLDKDGDGTVNYSELVASNNEFTEMEKKQTQAMTAITVSN